MPLLETQAEMVPAKRSFRQRTKKKVVLAKTLLKRCGVVPPPFNIGLALVRLIQAAIARSASAPTTSSQKVGLDQITRLGNSQRRGFRLGTFVKFRSSRSHVGKSQSRNQFWWG